MPSGVFDLLNHIGLNKITGFCIIVVDRFKTKNNLETVLIAGGTGLIGSHLQRMLQSRYKVHVLSRKKRKDQDGVRYFLWDIDKGQIDGAALDCDYIINLAGAGMADRRWTESRKKELIHSRVASNQTLLQGLRNSQRKLKAIVNASAIGYYGDRKDEWLDEKSEAGTGFMSDCCQLWEEASLELKAHTERLSIIRISLALTPSGGALGEMLKFKNLGIVPYFGAGSHYYSWIHIEDLCRMFIYALETPNVSGIFNGCAGEPITNKSMVKEICKQLSGFQIPIPAPVPALKIVLGEMSNMVLDSSRIRTSAIVREHGFRPQFTKLDEALQDLFKK